MDLKQEPVLLTKVDTKLKLSKKDKESHFKDGADAKTFDKILTKWCKQTFKQKLCQKEKSHPFP